MTPFGITLTDVIERGGAYAGIVAFFGLAVLVVLYFAQARELKRLREWAGRAPERAMEVEERVVAQAEAARRARTPGQPATAAGARPVGAAAAAGVPAAAGTAAAAAQGNGQAKAAPAVKPAAKPAPAGAPAAAAGSAAAAGTAAAAGSAVAASAAAGPGSAAPGQAAAPGDQEAQDGAAAPGQAAAAPGQDAATEPAATPAPAQEADGAAAGQAAPARENAGVGGAATAAGRAGLGGDAGATARQGTRPTPRPATATLRSGTTARRTPPRVAEPAPSRGRPIGLIIGIAIALAVIAVGLVVLLNGGGNGGGTSASPDPTQGAPSATATRTPRGSATPAAPSKADTDVAVLNGTTISGLAASVADRVRTDGYGEPTTGNYSDSSRAASVVFYSSSAARSQAIALGKTLSIQEVERAPSDVEQLGQGADVIVVVGADQTP